MNRTVLIVFAVVAVLAFLMVSAAAKFTPGAMQLSGSLFGGWWLLSAIVTTYMIRRDQRRLAVRC